MSTNNNFIHVGDIGTNFHAQILDQDSAAVNISGALELKLIFQKPSKTVVSKNAELYTDGTDGIMFYTTVSGDLNERGDWLVQGFCSLSNGSWHSSVSSFKVYANLE